MSLGSYALLKWINAQETLHARMHATFEKLALLKVRGRYTSAKGKSAFDKLVSDAAESYVAQQMTPLSVRDAFPAACRATAAIELDKAFRLRFKDGQWAALIEAQKVKDAAARKREREQSKRASFAALSKKQRMKRLLG